MSEEGEGETNRPSVNDGSISDRYQQAVEQIETAALEAIAKLELLQKDIATLALFSSNEGLEDISTKTLTLISLEHHLAMATLALPTATGKSTDRKTRVLHSMGLFSNFLQRLESLELLSDNLKKDFHELLDTNPEEPSQQRTAGLKRETKIARFRAKQEAQKDLQRLQSTQQRRGRLRMDAQEEMDGFDQEALERNLVLKLLQIHAAEAIDEWLQVLRELPMIEMAIQMESQRSDVDRHRGHGAPPTDDIRPPPTNKPLQLTHITLDSMTGQLNIRKEEILSQVFRPSWNQPTMTLEELGDKERAQAIEREAQQKVSEEQQKHEPRRYEQLLTDGMEDNHDLVDASADLDRKWDDWREENPRGCGNKMGDRGDRNF